ncbi:uncharacterized protein [Branchiostoma lanceolatum]|uniref:uncharacterized protein n=1 Tax=Branchiostoma lanceolatum TaxID=7740 RepID=UPI003453480A
MAFTAMLRRKLEGQGSENKTFVAKTGGKPMKFTHTPQPQKSSADASASTVAKRVRREEGFRDDLSGGCAEVQLAAEVARCKKDQLQRLLQLMDVGQVRIPSGHFLGMKTSVNINWAKCDELRRWMRQYGIIVESEKVSRARAAQLLSDMEVVCENLPFTLKVDDETKVVLRPCAYLHSMKDALWDFLKRSKEAGTLTWHGDAIPANEVWVKVGGDHGGGSFKFLFEVLNKARPNAIDNSVVVCVFEAKDSRENLQLALSRFSKEIQEIQQEMWRCDGLEYSIKLLSVGDYAYLGMIYGISGANGNRPCLWCDITQEDMKRERDDQPLQLTPRTLETLATHHLQFVTVGRSRRQRAKHHHNAIASAMFPIPIDQTIVPALHISLGVFLKLYKLLETDVHTMDLRLQRYLQVVIQEDELDRNRIEEDQRLACLQPYIQAIDKAQAYETEAENLQDTIEENEDNLALMALDQNVEDREIAQAVFDEAVAIIDGLTEKRDNLLEQAAEILSKASIKKGKGPFASSLEPVLNEFNVHVQAYHSRSFVGNDVHKMLHDKPIEALTSAVDQAVNDVLEGHPGFPLSLIPNGKEVARKYDLLFKLFAKCHRAYAHSKPMGEKDIDQLAMDIELFLQTYRDHSHVTSVKFHMLEHHVVPCIRRWGFGLGFMAEQGVEQIHSRFNTLGTSTSRIVDPIARLKSTMKTHLINVSPDHVGKAPKPVPRKKKV